MDKLSEFVKSRMLTYPSIYPTRMKVLFHSYCSIGNGLEWRNGVLWERGQQKSLRTTMDYDDLLKPKHEADWFERLENGPVGASGILEDIKKNWSDRTRAEFERRQAREAIIDQLASTPDTVTIFQKVNAISLDNYFEQRDRTDLFDPYSEPETFLQLSEGALRAPIWHMPKNVEPSFLRGGLEVMNAVIRSTTCPTIAFALENKRDQVMIRFKHLL